MRRQTGLRIPLLHESKSTQVAGLMSLVAVVSLVSSIFFLSLTTIRLNQTDIPPQEGQLLNRLSIEKAAQLLQEQTVVFNEESQP